MKGCEKNRGAETGAGAGTLIQERRRGQEGGGGGGGGIKDKNGMHQDVAASMLVQ